MGAHLHRCTMPCMGTQGIEIERCPTDILAGKPQTALCSRLHSMAYLAWAQILDARFSPAPAIPYELPFAPHGQSMKGFPRPN